MPEKGTSRISEIFSPVKRPPAPSFYKIYLNASVTPEYSWKPTTSKRVFTTIRGFDIIDWKVRELALAKKKV